MLATRRLRVEFTRIVKDPVPLALAAPLETNIYEWRFVIKGTGQYENGYYQGKIIFPAEYPLKPPSIIFLTPSGRFDVGKRICLSISDFHPETWSPSWTVGTILTGIVSFMNSEELTTGGLACTAEVRKRHADASCEINSRDKVFMEIFGPDPIARFQESELKMRENTNAHIKSHENTKAGAAPVLSISTVTPPALASVPGPGSEASTVAAAPLSKSARRRIKEKRRKEEAVSKLDGSVDADVVEEGLSDSDSK